MLGLLVGIVLYWCDRASKSAKEKTQKKQTSTVSRKKSKKTASKKNSGNSKALIVKKN